MTAPRSLRVVLGAFIAIGAVLAIYLSWGALHELALEVGGMPPERAAVFPIVVDLPAVAAMLIILFVSAPSRRLAALPWLTFGVFSVLTIAGNAASVAGEDPGRLALGIAPAVVVNSVPAIALLLMSHLAATTVYRVGDRVAHADPRRARVLELAASGTSQRSIATQVGVGRSTVARWLSQPNTEVAA